jgi:preprotein translocase subunit SecF
LDFVGKKRWFFLFSALLIGASIVSLLVPPSLVIGIDFKGGTSLSGAFPANVTQEELREVLSEFGHGDASIQAAGEGRFFIRTRTLAAAVSDEPSEREVLQRGLEEKLGGLEALEFSEVSSVFAQDTVRNAIIAVLAAAVGILLYITWAFRRVSNPFRYGLSAIIALAHDVFIVVGSFSILGKVIGAEVNTMFLTALLAVIGYSVNDTIVVFDRIRENVLRGVARDMDTVINLSLSETLGRSLNTSITLALTLLAILFMGGTTLRDFILVFLVGVVAGTYSSIGVASQILGAWEKGDLGRGLRWLRNPLKMSSK